ncbi:proliferating cell nuclear antigen (nucleomorph) [Bigelowiella natans]|uniref:DNA sliding clamp PCNA n=1 Tax=Bigelowiella natans TaxID=227086 RepID=Q3LWE0_BIGNA|nr:proliferating cell nuclear antigen [Bigelowiella natans]ABA27225.1 proliferating cell nuclear antigen [Bigelowiella natans]
MRKIIFLNPNKIIKLFESMKDLLSESTFEFKENFLTIQSIDHSHITLLEVDIQADYFENFKEFVGTKFKINFQGLIKALKTSTNEDSVMMKYDETTNFFSLVFENKDSRIAEYELNLFKSIKEKITVPVDKYDATISMNSLELTKLAKDLINVGDIVVINIHPGVVVFTAKGTSGRAIIIYKNTNNLTKRKVTVNCQNQITQSISLKYIIHFSKLALLSENVTLEFKTSYPMKLAVNFDGNSKIQYFLAPKLKNNYDI